MKDSVYPGDTIAVQARPTAEAHTFRVDAQVGDRSVLSHGVAVLKG